MKFGDKLCKLRKKEGLSQEELGDKLNVTRQTVSKWELGQSKPDTDKLVELCNLLGVNVNDLMDDNIEIKNNRHIDSIEVKPRKWLLVVLIIVALAISVALINKLIMINNSKKADKNDAINSVENIINNSFNQITSKSFNSSFEMYSGTESSISVKSLLDRVITNNKKSADHQIEITYKEVTTKDPEDIKNLKSSFVTSSDYEVSLDYDDDGFVNKVTIEDIFKDVSVSSFNIYVDDAGTKYGAHVKELLDRVITNNKKYPNHLITVIYSSTNTTDEEAIRNLKSKFSTFKEYEVIVNYDETGYVNEIKIK